MTNIWCGKVTPSNPGSMAQSAETLLRDVGGANQFQFKFLAQSRNRTIDTHTRGEHHYTQFKFKAVTGGTVLFGPTLFAGIGH